VAEKLQSKRLLLYHPQTGPHGGGDAVDLSLEHIAAFLDSELVIRSSTVGVAP
jgi:hypothetical protein